MLLPRSLKSGPPRRKAPYSRTGTNTSSPAKRLLSVHRSDRHPRPCYRLAAVLLLAHLLAVLALTASPRLHHWVHPDADDDDHDCAVVLLMHGGCGQPPAPSVLPAVVYTCQQVPLVEPLPVWVDGTFAVNGTLEHAPPLSARA